MTSFVLIGKSKGIAWPVLQAINGFANQKCILVGDKETSPLRWSSLCKEHLLIDFDEKDDTYFVNLVNGINGTKDNESNKINKEEVILIPYDCQGIRLVNQTRNFLRHNIIYLYYPLIIVVLSFNTVKITKKIVSEIRMPCEVRLA